MIFIIRRKLLFVIFVAFILLLSHVLIVLVIYGRCETGVSQTRVEKNFVEELGSFEGISFGFKRAHSLIQFSSFSY